MSEYARFLGGGRQVKPIRRIQMGTQPRTPIDSRSGWRGKRCPAANLMEFNEADFERAGYEAFDRFGPASTDNLCRMLRSYGSREE